MKNTEFLKSTLIVNKGIYDNQIIFENTLESFNEAILNKYSILFNLNVTKDNVIIAYYDNNLTRLLSLKDKITDVTYEELNYLCSYHVPTLDEVLNLIKGQVPIIIDIRNTTKKNYLEKELSKRLDEYKGDFAILSKQAKVIRWFNNNRPDYIIGEILTKKKRSFLNFLVNCMIVTDFKSINVERYNLYNIKKINESSLIIGYLINSQDKYQVYKDNFDNLIIDNVYELQMIEEIL